MKTCKKCSYAGRPKTPPLDIYEIAAWLFFMPFWFFWSITRRLESNMNKCPRCGGVML